MDPPRTRAKRYYQNRPKKPRSNGLINRLTYNPAKHKQKVTRKLRKELQLKNLPPALPPPIPPTSLKFGSFNVNGLDLEVSWAAEELLRTRGYDVSQIKELLFKF